MSIIISLFNLTRQVWFLLLCYLLQLGANSYALAAEESQNVNSNSAQDSFSHPLTQSLGDTQKIGLAELGPICGLRLGMNADQVKAIYPRMALRQPNSFGYTRAYIDPSIRFLPEIHILTADGRAQSSAPLPTFVEVGFFNHRLVFLYALYGLGTYDLFEDLPQETGLLWIDPLQQDTLGSRPVWAWVRGLTPQARQAYRERGKERKWASIGAFTQSISSTAGLNAAWKRIEMPFFEENANSNATSGDAIRIIETADFKLSVAIWNKTESIRLVDLNAQAALQNQIRHVCSFPELENPTGVGHIPEKDFYDTSVDGIRGLQVTFKPTVTLFQANSLLKSYGFHYSWIEVTPVGVKTWIFAPSNLAAFYWSLLEESNTTFSVFPYFGPTASRDTIISLGWQSTARKSKYRIPAATIHQRAIASLKRRYAHLNPKVTDIGSNASRLYIEGLRREVIRSHNYWERLVYRVFTIPNGNDVELSIVVDGTYATGVGTKLPNSKSYEFMDREYSEELDQYLERVATLVKRDVENVR